MTTFDGTFVAPGGTNAPSLEAIALGLARRPRFAGQTSQPFNVLAHSFLVADLIEDEAVKVHGLLHDAAEAIVGDIPTPWKTDADREREGEIIARVYDSLGLRWPRLMEAFTGLTLFTLLLSLLLLVAILETIKARKTKNKNKTKK